MTDLKRIERALISVSDKTGIVEFATALSAFGVDIISTGGTAKTLRENGIAVTDVADVTGFPEMMDGRVKTLHPKIHGALLALRENEEHRASMTGHDIKPIDMIVVNLYPFEQTVAKEGVTLEEAIENIDIGGPAMLRAAAKNHQSVTVIVDPADYGAVVDQLRRANAVDPAARLALAKKVFAHTANYDGAITNYLTSLDDHGTRGTFPDVLSRQWIKAQQMRYGENPHQRAAFYRERSVGAGLLAGFSQVQGKELSYNNVTDADAAWECVRSFTETACVIVKHANPCGVAIGSDASEAYSKAFKTDPTSAFGGVIAFNRAVDAHAAQAISRQFVEVVIAGEFSREARATFGAKPNVRLLTVPAGDAHNDFDFKSVGGGLLVQTPDAHSLQPSDLKIVTARKPSTQQMNDLMFAWKVAKFVKSNAIVFAQDGMTLGIGAGQMSRVDSARIASIKAGSAGLTLAGSAVASDAFFPFRDGLDVVVDAGASCVIQPGGSMRDEEVIAAANERGIAMVFTGIRHFRH